MGTDSSALDQVDDRQQHHRPKERNEQGTEAEVARVDGRAAEPEEVKQVPAEERPNDADDDIEEQPLLHHHLGIAQMGEQEPGIHEIVGALRIQRGGVAHLERDVGKLLTLSVLLG